MKMHFRKLTVIIRLLVLALLVTMASSAYAVVDFGEVVAESTAIERIYIEGQEKFYLPPGTEGQLAAETFPSGLRQHVRWKIVGQDDDLAVELDAATGLLVVSETSGTGWIEVQASADGCAPKTKRIEIGCGCGGQSGTCDSTAGAGAVANGSVDVRISLGTGDQGHPAGSLMLYAEEPLATLSTPEALVVDSAGSDVKPLYRDDQLVQLLTPQVIVSFVRFSLAKYEIHFYDISYRGTQTEDGLYSIDPTAVPLVVWRIENPDASGKTMDALVITELRGGAQREFYYSYTADEHGWSLVSGNGLRTESKAESFNSAGDRVVRTEIAGADGAPVRIEETVRHAFPFGEKRIRETVDPDGAALVTQYRYQTTPGAGYGKLIARIDPDGDWVRFGYDDEGRIIREVRPFLDAPFDAPEKAVKVETTSYAPVDGVDRGARLDRHRPRQVIKTICGIETQRTYYAYIREPDGTRTEIVERATAQGRPYGHPANLRMVTSYYPSRTKGPEAGKIKRRRSDDGLLTSYTYENGHFELAMAPSKCRFIPGKGLARRTTVTYGTEEHPEGIPYRTIRETIVADAMGREKLKEIFVRTVDGFERIDWQLNTHDRLGRVIETLHANGTRTESAWGCCGKTSETDVGGITTRYVYDDLKRLISRINKATGVTTSFTYDAAGRQLTTTQSNEGLTLTQESRYGRAGRLIEQIDPAGLVTRYTHVRNVATTIRPGGATEITAYYLDGRVRSVSGTAVVARYYRYGVDPDGHQWTIAYSGKENSPRWERTVRDIAGRVVRVEKPGFKGIEATRNIYDDKGRLIRIESPGRTATLYVYDSLGHRTMTGLDVDGNNQLILASHDRIATSVVGYRKIDGTWWQQKKQAVLSRENSAVETTVAIQRQRLTGWKHGIVAEQVTVDIHGNAIRTVVSLDRFKHTRIQNVFYPDASLPSQTVFVDGRLAAMTTKTGITRTFGYDALGRRIAVEDPRKGISRLHYDGGGRPAYVEDAAGSRTRFEYDPETGHRIAVYNPLNKVTRYAYNARGQLIRTWGEVPYPVAYCYDDYGQMAEMRTFRDGSGWDGATWPDGAGPGDPTRWHYQPATGLLLAKEDAKGNKTRYAYGPGGALAKRIWARLKNGRPLETTYHYDSDTGALLKIDYSDETADVVFAYDRMGRKVRVSDAAGIHHFTYSNSLQLESEGLVGQQIYQINRHYDDLGRMSGFGLDDGYEVSYGYDDKGRFSTVDWRTGTETGGVAYRYLEQSDRLAGMESEGGFSVSYDYEPHRDVKTAVTNRFQDRLISRYAYKYDPLGRRINVQTSGEAFEEPGFWLYSYNDRNEVTAASRFVGDDLKDQSRPLSDLEQIYRYDPIGNRTKVVEGGEAFRYQTNSLNQYEAISPNKSDNERLSYDADGNLIEDDRFRYSWNGENRLIAIEPKGMNSNQKRSEYVYDYLGRQVIRKFFNDDKDQYKLESETRSIYFGWNCIKESVMTEEGKLSEKHHVWNLDLSQTPQGAGGVGGLLSTTNERMTYTYCFDSNGNVRQLVGQNNGTIISVFEYDPFGGTVSASGSIVASNRFSTKGFDNETGLYYYGFRYYDPIRGRWLNRDPIKDQGGINLYTFVLNNSVNVVDKLGLISYVAYRKLNIPGGEFLWNRLWKVAGHVYLAFHVDGEGVPKPDRSKWCEFLIAHKFTKKAFPELNAKEYHEWITFSFHPASIDPATAESEGNLLLTLITTGSYVELNNILADINPAAGGGASTELISKEFDEESALFLRALESFGRKGSDYAGVFGNGLKRFNGYGFLEKNCGGWAKYIVDGAGLNWPSIARLYNLGTDVGGPLEYPAKIIDAFVRGIYFGNYDRSDSYDISLFPVNGIKDFNQGIIFIRVTF